MLKALPAGAAELSPDMATVAAAADKEGTVRIMWGDNVLGGSAGSREIQDSMNRMFGTHLRVLYVPGDSMPQVGNQIMAEAQAKHPASSDVWIAPTTHIGRGEKAGMLLKVDWKALLPGQITDKMVEADGGAVRFVSNIAGVSYNTDLLPHPPKTLEGFLAPEFKGKIATTPYAAGFDILATDDFWARENAGFRDQLPGAGERAHALQRGRTDCGRRSRGAADRLRRRRRRYPLAEKGARRWGRLSRARFLEPSGSSISAMPDQCGTSNALAEDCPRLQFDAGRPGIFVAHLVRGSPASNPGSHSAKLVADAEADGAKLKELDVAWWLAHPDAAEALDKAQCEDFRAAVH